MKDPKGYRAMVHFLDERYKRLPSDALGGLLGELSLDVWDDGVPADPAIAAEWDRAVDEADRESGEGRQHDSSFRRAS